MRHISRLIDSVRRQRNGAQPERKVYQGRRKCPNTLLAGKPGRVHLKMPRGVQALGKLCEKVRPQMHQIRLQSFAVPF